MTKKYYIKNTFHGAMLSFVLIFSSWEYGYCAPLSTASEIEEVIITALRQKQDANAFAGSLSKLSNEQLQLTSFLHVQEALNQLPGVNFHRNDGQESLPSVRSAVLSGPGACGSILTAEDNVPLRPVGFCNVNELFEAHAEQAQRIEVIRGPSTALYGSRALHGVVNIIAPASFAQAVEIGIDVGAYDFSRIKLRGGSNSFGFAFTGAHDGGYRDNSGNDQQKISLLFRTKTQQLYFDSRFTATNLNQETAGFIEGKDAFKNKSTARKNDNPKAFRDAQSVRFSTKIQSLKSTSNWLLTPYLRYSKMDFLQHFLPGKPLEKNGHTSVGMLSNFVFKWQNSLSLITGIDFEYADIQLKQFQKLPTEGSTFLQETVPQGAHYDYTVRSRVISPYSHLEWQVNSALTTVVGLRFEQVNYDYNNHLLNGRTRDDGTNCGFGGCRYSRPANRTDTFNNFSPKLGLLYQVNKQTQVYLNYASGFRAPEVTELYRLQRNQLTAELESEHINSIELGFRGSFYALDFDIAAYRMEKSDSILRDVNFFNVSNGKTRHKGIEFNLHWTANKFLAFDINGTYAEHYYANNPNISTQDIIGNDVDSAPRRFGSARIEYRPSAHIRTQIEWLHMDKYFTDPESQHSYNGHNLLNLRMHWQPIARWQFSLQLNNVLDARYAERADYTSFTGNRYIPGYPRRVYVGVSYQL